MEHCDRTWAFGAYDGIGLLAVGREDPMNSFAGFLRHDYMMGRLLILILSLSALAVASAGQGNHRPGDKKLSWGVKAGGFRMAVWTNPATDRVFGAVRNFSGRKLCYCGPDVNNFTVYARRTPDSPWQTIGFKTTPGEVVLLPVCNIVNVMPGEEMPVYKMSNGRRMKENYSFSLDLREYSFPAEWSGRVQVAIVQHNVYCNPPRNKLGEVASRPVEIKLPLRDPS